MPSPLPPLKRADYTAPCIIALDSGEITSVKPWKKDPEGTYDGMAAGPSGDLIPPPPN